MRYRTLSIRQLWEKTEEQDFNIVQFAVQYQGYRRTIPGDTKRHVHRFPPVPLCL